jgi:microcystin-dependent protein
MMIQGTPYVVTYNGADGVFYLRGFCALPYVIPIGGLMPYLSPSAPNSNFALPVGQAISRTTYSTLFSLVGTTFGGGDGSTTFNIPDLRGRAVFGLDNMGGLAASRITVAGGNYDGSALGGVGGAQNHTLSQSEIPSHQHAVFLRDTGHTHTLPSTLAGAGAGGTNALFSGGVAVSTNAATTGVTIGSVSGVANDNQTAAIGGGSAHSIMPPSIVLPFILRVI